jgi:hypothetical protein
MSTLSPVADGATTEDLESFGLAVKRKQEDASEGEELPDSKRPRIAADQHQGGGVLMENETEKGQDSDLLLEEPFDSQPPATSRVRLVRLDQNRKVGQMS